MTFIRIKAVLDSARKVALLDRKALCAHPLSGVLTDQPSLQTHQCTCGRCSATKSCPALYSLVDCSSPGPSVLHCPPAFAQGNACPFYSKHTHLGLLVQTGGEGGIHTHTLNIRLQIFSTSSPKTQFFVGKQQNHQGAPFPRWEWDRQERTGMSMPPSEPSQPMAPGNGSIGLSQAGLPRWH